KGGAVCGGGGARGGGVGVREGGERRGPCAPPPRLGRAIMAGGRGSVSRSRGGAEDDEAAARRVVRARVRRGDVVVGVSASGVTPFVRTALTVARRQGAATVPVAWNAEGAHGSRSAANPSVGPGTG